MGDGRLTDAAWELELEHRARRGLSVEADMMQRLSRDPTLDRIDFALAGRYGEAGRKALETNAEAKAIHDCAVRFIYDLMQRR